MSDPTTPAVVTDTDRYLFDLQGYLHLRGALAESDRVELLEELTRQEELDHDDSRWNPPDSGVKPDLPTKMVEPGQIRLNGLMRMSPVFDRCIDYPSVYPYLCDFMPGAQLGNSWSITKTAGKGPGWWHSGLGPEQYRFHNGRIVTRMINTIFFLTDNGPDDGCVAVIPGSHKANYTYKFERARGLDVPGSIAVTGKAGDILIFTESLIHNGLANTSGRRRSNLYFNHNGDGFVPLSQSVAFSYNYAMPPHIRARFTASQKQATSWMEFARTID